jgi:hypothetical protein
MGLSHHHLGNRADQIEREFGLVGFLNKALDLAHTHATGTQTNDVIIKACKAAFVFRNEGRL